MSAFMGMIGNGDWVDDQMPENWRETILYEEPNGDAPLTAMLSMMGSEPTDSYKFHWWTHRLPSQSGDVGGVYIDAGLSTAYVYATHQSSFGSSGDTIFVKIAEALCKEFRVGHKVTLRDSDRFKVDVSGKVVDVRYNGASSYVAVKLLEDDDNDDTAASYNLATVDRIMITGNINPEGGALPRAVRYLPVGFENATGIYRTPLEITRTAKKTRLRTGNQVEQAKKEALVLHGIEMEKDLLWGVYSDGIGENGKPEHTPWGIIPFVKTYATSVAASGQSSYQDYRYNTTYTGQSWLDGGEDWLESLLEYVGTYCNEEMVALCGAGALTGLNNIAKYTGQINMQPGPNKTYGMRFKTWTGTHVTLHLKKHPLLARESSTKNMMIVLDPKNIKERPLDDTQYLPDRGAKGIDGEASEFLTESGPEIHFPDQFLIMDGVGLDSEV